METFKWSRGLIGHLILHFQLQENLYNTAHPSYKNKFKRVNSLNEILIELKNINTCITMENLKTKLKSLRTQYIKEHKKVSNSRKRGNGSDKIYKPKLWCYQELAFLKPRCYTKSSVSRIDKFEFVKVDTFKWPRDLIEALIVQYSSHEHLYNVHHPYFANDIKREQSLIDIFTILKEINDDVTLESVKAKIYTLRCQYVKEYRLLEASKEREWNSCIIYRPRLWCYKQLDFLRPYCCLKQSKSLIESEDSIASVENDFIKLEDVEPGSPSNQNNELYDDKEATRIVLISNQNVEHDPKSKTQDTFERSTSSLSSANASASEATGPESSVYNVSKTPNVQAPSMGVPTLHCSANTSKRKSEDCIERVLDIISNHLSSPRTHDHLDYAAKNWVATLRSVPKDQMIYAVRVIGDVMCEAQLGNLNRNSRLAISDKRHIEQF